MPGEVVKALTRSYQIKQFSWSTGDAAGTELATLTLPYDLLQLPFLADKVKYYAWLRAKAKLTFRVNSTKFDYGAVMISHLPFYQPGSGFDWRMGDLYHSSMCNPKILSAQQGSTIEFTMPWVNPKVYALTSSPLPEIGTVSVRVLHKLSSASADPPSSITITVFANLEEPELAGFAPDTSGPTPVLMEAWKKFIGDRNKTMFAEGEQPKSEQKKVRRQKVSSKPDMRVFGEAQSKGGKTVTKEAEDKAKAGVLSGIADGVATVAPLLSAIPVVGEFAAPAGVIAGALSPIFKMFGLNKPTSMAVPTKLIPMVDPGLSLGRGLDVPVRLSLDPENMLSVTKGLVGPDNPQPTLLEIMKTPSLVMVGSFNNTTSVNTRIFRVPVHSCYSPKVLSAGGQDHYALSYMAYYSQFARWWRGSIKFRIHFVTSSFVTCRVRISHLFENLTSDYDQVSGDLVSRVVDITGDTVVDFTAFYIHEKLYLQTKRPNAVTPFVDGTGVIDVSLVNPVVSVDTTANPLIYYSVWMAAGEDYRLMQFGDMLLAHSDLGFTHPGSDRQIKRINQGKLDPVGEIGEAQCDVKADFMKTFPGLVPGKFIVEAGVVNGEDFGTLSTLLHRYVVKKPLVPSGTNNVQPFVATPNEGVDTHVALMAPFQFQRGAVRWYDLLQASESVSWMGAGPNDYASNGYHYGGISFSPLHVEFPWYDERLFIETCPTIDTNRPQLVHLQRSSSTAILYSLGDDLSVGSLAATPWWQTATPVVLEEDDVVKRVEYSGCNLAPYLDAKISSTKK